MNEKLCTIDGVTYEAKEGGSGCEGCAGENDFLCTKLENCWEGHYSDPKKKPFIWVPVYYKEVNYHSGILNAKGIIQ